jgi:hypothetical protein
VGERVDCIALDDADLFFLSVEVCGQFHFFSLLFELMVALTILAGFQGFANEITEIVADNVEKTLSSRCIIGR